ncbi:MAG: LTA synthase family protein, partial [Methylophilus sp.]
MPSSYFGTPRPRSKLWTFGHWFGPYAPLIVMFLTGLVFLSLTRLGLVGWKWERVLATGELIQILLQGVRVDLIQLGLLAIIPVLLSPILATRKLFHVWRAFTFWWVLLSLVLLVFLEAATPGFILEYDVRPNRIFVEYLKYPHEVFGMLWQGFKIELFFGLGMAVLAFVLVYQLLKPWREAESTWSNPQLWLVWPVILVLTAFGVRSTLTHRPANPALFAITQDSMVNSLILNSTYSVFYAAYSLQHEAKSSEMYGKLPREKIFAITGAKEGDIPTLTTLVPSVKREKPLNLVILLQESLGAGFVESLGGKPVTPNLEQLKSEGIWFTHLYATGTRSVRGIEAVVTGFQPTPADSTVKLGLSQGNFFTLAS